MKKILLFSLIVILGGLGSSLAYAQTADINASDITMTFAPEVPSPNTNVHATLESFAINLDNLSVSWFVNNKLVSKDTGLTDFDFTTGDIGTTTTITALVTLPNGQVIDKTISLSPSRVDILWEVLDAYEPPFYKGHSLPGSESRIRFTAIPETSSSSLDTSSAMTYYWKRNFEALPNLSGYGRQSIILVNNILDKSETVSVTSSTTDGGFSASKEISLAIQNPLLVFYQKDNNGRIRYEEGYTTALSVPSADHADLVVLPYHISIPDNFSDLVLNWRVNDQDVSLEDQSRKNELTILLPKENGASRLSISAENTHNILQTAQANLTIYK